MQKRPRCGAEVASNCVAVNSDSGYDVVAPSGVGGERCMKIAMSMADDIAGEKEVGYVNTHGTSTPVGDLVAQGYLFFGYGSLVK